MSLLDGTIISVYLATIVAIGVRSRGRQETAGDYFAAQRGFGGIIGTAILGLSLGATMLSSLSVVAFPSIVYSFGITSLTAIAGYPFAYLALRYWFLPRFLARTLAAPYDVIEQQYGRTVRLVASGMFVTLRLCWMAALIYATAVLINATCRLGPEWY